MPAFLLDETARAESMEDVLTRLDALLAQGPEDAGPEIDESVDDSFAADVDVPLTGSAADDEEEELIAW